MSRDRQSKFAPYARRMLFVLSVVPILVYLAVDTFVFQMPEGEIALADGVFDFLFDDAFGRNVLMLIIMLWATIPALIWLWFVIAPRDIRVEGDFVVSAGKWREQRHSIAKFSRVQVESHKGECHYINLFPAKGQPISLEPVSGAEDVARIIEDVCARLEIPFRRVEHKYNPRGVLNTVVAPLAMAAIFIVLLRVFVPGGLGSLME